MSKIDDGCRCINPEACSPSPDAWGRLNVVTPFDHLSEDSHINCPLRAGPITASSELAAHNVVLYQH
jgi:hypothetical protein